MDINHQLACSVIFVFAVFILMAAGGFYHAVYRLYFYSESKIKL